MFHPISDNVALSQKIVSQVTEAIIKGELKIGDRIPPERDLANTFGVSRTAIRDAIKILSGRGVLDVKHGVGIFVAESVKKEYGMDFAGEQLRDLFEIRKTLETQAAAWAADRADSDYVSRLRTIVDEAKEHSSNLQVLAEKDAQFHMMIAEASKNLLIVKIMWTLLDTLEESRTKALTIPNRALASLSEHEQVLKAIAEHNQERARESMHKHLDSVEHSIFKSESNEAISNEADHQMK